ncbi:hypothetical protein H4582DRAFT_1959002 [Lactarius indigo]|nr:hypothetical protein H4582DRAFT_1959002 [Lactarius indigo]
MQYSVGHTPQVHDRGPPSPGESIYATHTYVMKTDYAFVSIRSRARNIHDVPLMYLEEKTIGTVVLSEYHLHEVRSIVVVLRVLDSNTVKQASKTKLKLSSEEIHRSHTSNGQFRWQFAIYPPTTTGSSLSPLTASEQANSTLRRPSTLNHQSFQLRLTIHRGFFLPKIRMKRSIRYVPRPGDLSTPLPSPLSPAVTPRNLPPWTGNKCPEVIVRGVIFGRRDIEVECRLIIPKSYPVNDSDTIPLRLDMICEDREALDLFAVPHVIDVRLLKVIAFGKNAAAAAPPFSLKNRRSYHITNWVASALWNVDGHTVQENAGRLRIRLNGRLLRDPGAEISKSFAEPGMALMYYVCLFPFRSGDFRPLCTPDRAIFYGKIPLTE